MCRSEGRTAGVTDKTSNRCLRPNDWFFFLPQTPCEQHMLFGKEQYDAECYILGCDPVQSAGILSAYWGKSSHPEDGSSTLRQNVCKFLPGYTVFVCQDSSVGIATRYGLDGPGIEYRWRRDFPHPSRPALGTPQPHVQRVPGLSRG
jgi:hypothetical protein